ncbi:MAG TPA: tetratricopeptide repeat protein [Polyangia bacterium]|nr:tetratricopeptide repeat protein [Polyangia bacterium]
MAKSISKKELKELRQPDEFVSFWTQAAQRGGEIVKERRRALIIGATALATAVVGSIVFSNLSEGRAERATEALTRIERIATADLKPDVAPTPGADTPPPADDGVPHYKTDKERAEATLKELDGFLAGSPGPLANQARLERGPLLLTLGRAPEAISSYEAILADKLDDRLRFLAREGLGYAQEAKGDLEAASATFAKLTDDAAVFEKSGAGFYKDRALYHKARISELRGNADDAKKIYREVLDQNPTTSLRDDITNRLAVLELK